MTEHKIIDLTQLAKVRDGTGHTIFSPSSSHMWLTCSGSLIPNLLAGDDAGVEAAYGTVAHSVAEEWLRSGKKPRHMLGTNQFIDSGDWGYLIDIDEEMFGYVQQCVNRSEMLPGDHITEQKVWFSQLTPIPCQGGTMDHAALRRGRATVDDHKFGKSPDNMVMAEENSQGMLYALGILYEFDEKYNFKDFVIRINQPHLDHFDEWHTTRKRLLEFAEYVKERAHKAWQLNAPRTADVKACRFCKVTSSCAANAKLQVDLIEAMTDIVFGEATPDDMLDFKDRLTDEFDPFVLKPVDTGRMTTEQMGKLYKWRKSADAFWASLALELFKRGQDGEDLTPHNLKLVEARTRRYFKDSKKAERHLVKLGLKREEVVTEKLVSPSQAEKLLKKRGFKHKEMPELLADLVDKPKGMPTLASLNDKRPAIVDLGDLVFDDPCPENDEDEEF